jgi:hypothetical protein
MPAYSSARCILKIMNKGVITTDIIEAARSALVIVTD